MPHSVVGGRKSLESRFSRGGKSKMTKPARHDDSFDQHLLTELEILRSGEERLRRLLPSLRLLRQLRKSFLQELAEIQERAEQLDAMLNCSGTFEAAPVTHSQLSAA